MVEVDFAAVVLLVEVVVELLVEVVVAADEVEVLLFDAVEADFDDDLLEVEEDVDEEAEALLFGIFLPIAGSFVPASGS